MERLKEEAAQLLTERILPFWMKLKDERNGGFYGRVNADLAVDRVAPKGGVYGTRLLWTFSAAYRAVGNAAYLACAEHAYAYLRERLHDPVHQGIYWLTDAQGQPLDDRKHLYAQAFAIYALSEYYRASGNPSALELAQRLFELIERVGFEPASGRYKEEFTRDWRERPNELLGGKGTAELTMNTHLHLLEAYTNLYRAWPSAEVKERLTHLVHLFRDRIYDPDTGYMIVFMDRGWNRLTDLISYGHDIEASWLIDDALRALGIEDAACDRMIRRIAYTIADAAMLPDGSVANEKEGDRLDDTRVWWVQAEAVVGFVNAWSRTGDSRFGELAQQVWSYIGERIVDARPSGEWHAEVNAAGQPARKDAAGPWKANYHNGRCCLQLMERLA